MIIRYWTSLKALAIRAWRRFRALPFVWQAVIVGAILALLIVGIAFLKKGGAESATDQLPTVTLATAGSLSGTGGGASLVGAVRAVSEADLVAGATGAVKSVHAVVGQQVGAGYVLAELDNDTQQAQVLSAQGSYDAAVAARAAVSPSDSATTARNAYRSAYSTLETALTVDVDQFFGEQTAVGPRLLISAPAESYGELSRERQALTNALSAWQAHLATAATADPGALLSEAQGIADQTTTFLNRLAEAANASDSNATQDQLAALAAARASVNGVEASLASAQSAYRGASVSSTAGADASQKQALGALRLAQASLEKTLIRTPIAGTVNALPLHTGDYVNQGQQVAVVAQNGALEIDANATEDQAASLAAGQKVVIDGKYAGVITSIAPALDPVTKQIEVRIAASGANSLVNGQSVRVSVPDLVAATDTVASSTASTLPLTAVKLAAGSRAVFTVEDGVLVAHTVDLGAVHGSQVDLATPIPADMLIVTDVRGLAEGQRVQVASTTAP